MLGNAPTSLRFYDGGNNANGTGNIGMAVGWAEEMFPGGLASSQRQEP